MEKLVPRHGYRFALDDSDTAAPFGVWQVEPDMFEILFPSLKDGRTSGTLKDGRNDRLVNRASVLANAPSTVERLKNVSNRLQFIREDGTANRTSVGLDKQTDATLITMPLQIGTSYV